MKTVTSIKENTKKKTFEVSFGLEKFSLSIDSFTDHYLYVGKEINEKEFLEIKRSAENEKIYKYALKLAISGSYSTYEVKEKLKKKISDPLSIISKLKDRGLLNDEEYALEYKEEKEKQLYGENRIKDDLLHKKMISPEIVANLEFLNEEENAKKLLQIYEKRLCSLPIQEKKRKAMDILLRKGYSSNAALTLLSSLKEDKEKSQLRLRKEFEQLKKRYQNKYDGYSLKSHIYQALIRRGYNQESIKEVMEDEIYDD